MGTKYYVGGEVIRAVTILFMSLSAVIKNHLVLINLRECFHLHLPGVISRVMFTPCSTCLHVYNSNCVNDPRENGWLIHFPQMFITHLKK